MSEAAKFALGLTALVLGGLAWWVSRQLGADFGVTLYAVIALLAVTVGVAWFSLSIGISFSKGLAGWAMLAWPCTFRVLDNIAANASPFGMHYDVREPWYSTALFQYGLEGVLVVMFLVVFFKSDY